MRIPRSQRGDGNQGSAQCEFISCQKINKYINSYANKILCDPLMTLDANDEYVVRSCGDNEDDATF